MPGTAGCARAVQIELAPPSPSVARSLRPGAGEPVAHHPIALTTAMLRPDLFRIVVHAAAATSADGTGSLATAWTRTAPGWEP